MVDAEPSSNTVGEYNIGQDNIQLLGLDIHNPVFAIAALTIVLFVVFFSSISGAGDHTFRIDYNTLDLDTRTAKLRAQYRH